MDVQVSLLQAMKMIFQRKEIQGLGTVPGSQNASQGNQTIFFQSVTVTCPLFWIELLYAATRQKNPLFC